MNRCIEITGSLTEQLDQPMLQWTATYARATQALIAGDTDRAEELVMAALQLENDSGQPDTVMSFALQQMAVHLQRGTMIELIPLIEQMASEITEDLHMVNAALSLAFPEGDRIDDGRARSDEFSGTGFAFLVDASWVIGMCGFAEGAIVVEDPAYARPLFDQLAPWAGQFCTTGITAQGPVSHYVAGLATVLGRLDEADIHFAQAAAMNERARAKFFTARTDLSWGRMLARRSAPGDAEKARNLLITAQTLATDDGYETVRRRASEALQILDL